MNPNRRAKLQRRLAMTSVPEPPGGLAERIKRDIPDLGGNLRPGERYATRGFVLRVAASLVLVVGSVILGVTLLTRSAAVRTPPVAIQRPAGEVTTPEPPPTRLADSRGADETSTPPVAEAIATSHHAVAPSLASTPIPAPPQMAQNAPEAASELRAPASAEGGMEALESVTPGRPAAVTAQVEDAQPAKAAAPAIAAERSEKAADTVAPKSEVTLARASGASSARAGTGELASEATARDAGRSEMVRARQALESGQRPHDVNVAAFVSYFTSVPPAAAGDRERIAPVATRVADGLAAGVDETTVRSAEALARDLPANARVRELAEIARLAMRRP